MMKALFAAALMMSGAALAQETTTEDMTTEDTTAEDTTAEDTTATAKMPTTTATMPMTTSRDMAVAPGNTAPKRDSRGIAVMSNAAMAPDGVNQMVVIAPGAQVVPNPNQAAAFQTRPAAGDYPACSRTVTDNCVQTYERSRR